MLEQQTTHPHTEQPQPLVQRRAFECLACRMADRCGLVGVAGNGLVPRGDAKVRKAQLHADGAAHVALALQIGRHLFAQLGEDRAQRGAVVYRVQIALKRGLAAHAHRLAAGVHRTVVAPVRCGVQPGTGFGAEVLRQCGRVCAGELADGVYAQRLQPGVGFGADAVILTIATPANEPMNLAFDLCRTRGRVVGVGLFGMDVNRGKMFSREVTLVPSIAYGTGRYDSVYEEGNIDFNIGYARWTENRNQGAFLRLLAEGKIDLSELAPTRVPIADAPKGYDLLHTPNRPPTVMFTYGKD